MNRAVSIEMLVNYRTRQSPNAVYCREYSEARMSWGRSDMGYLSTNTSLIHRMQSIQQADYNMIAHIRNTTPYTIRMNQ